MSVSLVSPLTHARASRYTDPGNAGDILPIVYGDFTDAGGIAGSIPCVLINKTSFMYTPAQHVMGSVTAVFVGEVLKTGGGVDYTLTLSNNYESQGLITTIDFVTQPDGPVTCRGTGKQSGGVTITNLITQLEDLLTTYGGFVSTDLESTHLEVARAVVTTQAFQTAWVINDERAIAEWVNEMMFNVMGSWHLTGDGKLAFYVDTTTWPRSDEIVAHIVAARDVVDGDDGVEMSGDIRHLVNALNVDYLWNWTLGSRSSRITSEQDAISLNIHGEVRQTVTLRGLRAASYVTTWATVLFERQAFRRRVEGALIRFSIAGPKLANAMICDWIGVTWKWGPRREENNDYVNQICRIISLRHIFEEGDARTEVEAIDIGAYIISDVLYDATVDFDAAEWFGGGRQTAVLT